MKCFRLKTTKARWGMTFFTWFATVLVIDMLYSYGYLQGYDRRTFEVMALALGVVALLNAFLMRGISSQLLQKSSWLYLIFVPFFSWVAFQSGVYLLVFQLSSTNDPAFKFLAPVIDWLLNKWESSIISLSPDPSWVQIVQGLFLFSLLAGSIIWISSISMCITYYGLRRLATGGALRYWKRIVIFMLCLTMWVGISFAVPGTSIRQIEIEEDSLRLESDFPVWANISVNSILHDQWGNLWAGTNAGLYNLMENEWTRDYSLGNDSITALLET